MGVSSVEPKMTTSWYEKNKDSYNKKRRKKYKEDKEYRNKKVKRSQNYRSKNPEKKKEQNKKYSKSSKGRIVRKNERIRNKDHYKKQSRKYFKKESVKKRRNEINKVRLNEDKVFAIKKRLRNSLLRSLNLYSKQGKITSSKNYGIDWSKVVEYLKPFPKDLSNYHVDHIKPLCSFDLTDPEEVKKAFAPENHQWLTVEENLKKSKN